VNEALACGRPVLVSDRVGCAADVVDAACGGIFPWSDLSALGKAMDELLGNANKGAKIRRASSARAWSFDVGVTEATLVATIAQVSAR
jgi:glycosyltransferase involved in cell wall biosynthesis